MQHPDHDVNGDELTRNDRPRMRRYAVIYHVHCNMRCGEWQNKLSERFYLWGSSQLALILKITSITTMTATMTSENGIGAEKFAQLAATTLASVATVGHPQQEHHRTSSVVPGDRS